MQYALRCNAMQCNIHFWTYVADFFKDNSFECYFDSSTFLALARSSYDKVGLSVLVSVGCLSIDPYVEKTPNHELTRTGKIKVVSINDWPPQKHIFHMENI